MNAFVSCRIRRGLFSNELGVVVSSTGGEDYSFFTDRAFVQADKQPTEGEEVPGQVRVAVVRMGEGERSALVQLPSSSSNMSRVWVTRDQLATT